MSEAINKGPTHAIVCGGVVVGRFNSKEAAINAIKDIPEETRRQLKISPINSPVVKRYYRMVNKVRRKAGLPPINPRRWMI